MGECQGRRKAVRGRAEGSVSRRGRKDDCSEAKSEGCMSSGEADTAGARQQYTLPLILPSSDHPAFYSIPLPSSVLAPAHRTHSTWQPHPLTDSLPLLLPCINLPSPLLPPPLPAPVLSWHRRIAHIALGSRTLAATTGPTGRVAIGPPLPPGHWRDREVWEV